MEEDKKRNKEIIKFYKKTLENFARDNREKHVFPSNINDYVQSKLTKHAMKLDLRPMVYGRGKQFS